MAESCCTTVARVGRSVRSSASRGYVWRLPARSSRGGARSSARRMAPLERPPSSGQRLAPLRPNLCERRAPLEYGPRVGERLRRHGIEHCDELAKPFEQLIAALIAAEGAGREGWFHDGQERRAPPLIRRAAKRQGEFEPSLSSAWAGLTATLPHARRGLNPRPSRAARRTGSPTAMCAHHQERGIVLLIPPGSPKGTITGDCAGDGGPGGERRGRSGGAPWREAGRPARPGLPGPRWHERVERGRAFALWVVTHPRPPVHRSLRQRGDDTANVGGRNERVTLAPHRGHRAVVSHPTPVEGAR